jgi:REP element-mobilizing transposase RayT
MTEKFRNRYRVKTSRLKDYDYTRSGAYFVTICTQKKIPYFGFIERKIVFLSEVGILVKSLWNEIPDHFSNVILDEFIIMPDHIHGIIIIKSNVVETPKLGTGVSLETPKLGTGVSQETPKMGITGISQETTGVSQETPKLGVSTIPLESKGNPNWKSKSLGSIINQFKRICTIKAKSSKLDLEWQPRYYDHIIHSDYKLKCIREYIKDNPENWD